MVCLLYLIHFDRMVSGNFTTLYKSFSKLKTTTMKTTIIQYDPAWEDKQKNKEKLQSLLEDSVTTTDLIIFPEMTLTGFTMKSEEQAEAIDGESFEYFASVAKKYNADVFAGVITHEDGKIFNSLLHITSDGTLKSQYRKIHPFSYSGEDEHYEAGSEPVITEVNDWKIGLTICYDLRFPELYRHYGHKRVDAIINIANWPQPRIHHWKALLKARAIENLCYVAGINRVGSDPKVSYIGASGIYAPNGDEICLIQNVESAITINIEKSAVDETRKRFPFLEDITML